MKHFNEKDWEQLVQKSRQEKAPDIDVRYQVRQSITHLLSQQQPTTLLDDIFEICVGTLFKTATFSTCVLVASLYFYAGHENLEEESIPNQEADPVVSFMDDGDWSLF